MAHMLCAWGGDVNVKMNKKMLKKNSNLRKRKGEREGREKRKRRGGKSNLSVQEESGKLLKIKGLWKTGRTWG